MVYVPALARQAETHQPSLEADDERPAGRVVDLVDEVDLMALRHRGRQRGDVVKELGLGVDRVARRHDQHVERTDSVLVLDAAREGAFAQELADHGALAGGLAAHARPSGTVFSRISVLSLSASAASASRILMMTWTSAEDRCPRVPSISTDPWITFAMASESGARQAGAFSSSPSPMAGIVISSMSGSVT